ncbi:MAG: nuclear transport factor 2 family protein [Bacteroidales bacterium]|nr:nuclear transport factor 2 family protein [Bacteroidales bacterium]
MKKLNTVFILAMFLGYTLNAQDDQKAEIIQTAFDYADGFYSSNAERFERAIHPDFNKVLVYKVPQTGKIFLQYSTVSGLVEYIKTKSGFVEPDKRKTNASVLSVNEDVATVKLTSAFFNDFLCLVNFDGQWKIVNVLWSAGHDTPNIPQPVVVDPDREKTAVETTINDYYSGIYSGDVDRLSSVIHPEISIAQLKTNEQTGKYSISRNGASFIVELTRAGFLKVAEDKRNINIEILDFMDEMAIVRATSTKSISYFQLQQIDQQWKVINILSIPKIDKTK